MRFTKPMRNIINDIPLTYKFLMIYICCFLVPIIAVHLFFYDQNAKQIREREDHNLRTSVERAANEIKGMIDESIIVSHSIESDRLLAEALDRTYTSPIEYFDTYSTQLRDRLSRSVLTYPSLVAVEMYLDNPTFQSSGNYYGLKGEYAAWTKQLPDDLGRFRILVHEEMKRNGSGIEKKISIVKELRRFPDLSEYRKVLRIDLNVDKLYDILGREQGTLFLRLVDERGRVIASGYGLEKRNATAAPYQAEPNDLVHAIGERDYMRGWKLIGKANDTRMQALLDESRRSIAWLAVISTLLPSLLIYIILRSYHYRIKKLARHMQKARHEKFDLIQMSEGADEIGGLIRTYNLMAERIHALINDVYKLEIKQKNLEIERIRAEMNMLHSQMNPHFLFNVLNALLVVSTANGYAQVTDVIRNLALMLRRLLTWKEDVVALKDELDFTRMYLELEKFRFGERLAYEFDIDPSAMACRIPRMSVQPLVENACKHGLQRVRRKGWIRVSAHRSGDELVVTVTDNGAGIEEELLPKIRQAVHAADEMQGHVGIRNVFRRLELFCEVPVKIELSSEHGEGTTIEYRIPLHSTV